MSANIDDPDLKPLPPARRVVSSWSEVTSLLRARSADLRIAIDEVGRAEAQRRVAVAGVLGSISTSATYQHDFMASSSADSLTGSVTATFPVIAPRAWNAIRQGDANVAVTKASLDDAKRTLAVNVTSAALTVVTTEHVADLNRVGLRQALERLELAERKTSLGAGTGLDVVRARQDVENARSTLLSGDESARQAREAFGLSIGVADAVGVAGDLSFEAITRDVIAQCKPEPSVEERPDVVAARARVRASRVNTWDVTTQFFPTLALQSTLTATTVSGENAWNVQAVLSWNIWDGGARYGNMRDANLQVLEAGERLDATRRSAVIQVVQADRAVIVANDSRDVAAMSRDLAAEIDRMTRASFETGQGTSLDLVTAAASLRQAEINLALADYGVVKARVLAVLSLASCPF